MVDLNRQLSLKTYIYYNLSEDGVFFQGREGSFILKGASLYPLISRFVGLMDAGHTCQAILDQLPDKLQPVFEQFLSQLEQNDMLVDKQLFADIKEEYSGYANIDQLLDYLQDRLGDFRARFEQWRDTNLYVVGEGYALKAAIDALAGSGLRRLTVLLHDHSTQTPSEPEYRAILDQAAARLPGFEYELSVSGEPAAGRLQQADYVLFAYHQLSGEPIDADIAAPFLVTGVLDGAGLISPLARSGASDYFDIRERLRSAPDDAEVFSPVAMSMLGSLAAFHLLRFYFDIDTDLLRNYVTRVSPHLDVSRHPLLPRQLFAGDGRLGTARFEQELEVPQDRELDDYEQLLIELAPLFDKTFGPFDRERTKTLRQVPLFHDALDVRFAHSSGRAPETIVAWGFDVADAGSRVLKQGLSRLATADNPELDRCVVTEFDREQWLARATAVALAASTGFGANSDSALVSATDIDDRDIQMLYRILQLYLGTRFSVELHWWRNRPAYVARVVQAGGNGDGAAHACAIQSTPVAAIREALGIAYCRHHFAEFAIAGDSSGWLGLTSAGNPDPGGRTLSDLARTTAEPVDVEVHLFDSVVAGEAVFSGYVEVQS